MLKTTCLRPLATPAGARSFVTAGLLALTNSNFFRQIKLADEMENIDNDSILGSASSTTNALSKDTNRYPDGRYKLSGLERATLFTVSGISAFLHPEIGANINNFGEVSSFECVLKSLRDAMLRTDVGRQILRERPVLNDTTLDPAWLKSLPETSLGFQYHQFTRDGDARAPVKFIDDEELAYVFLRYRQIHDIVHILTNRKIDLAGELPVKAFEFGNTGLPMTGLACFAYFKLSSKRKNKVNMVDSFINGLETTPLITVYWEKMMEKDVDAIRAELGIL